MALKDTLAERLRRQPAKPMGSPRVGSNPTGVVFIIPAKVNKHMAIEVDGPAEGLQRKVRACVAATAQLVP